MNTKMRIGLIFLALLLLALIYQIHPWYYHGFWHETTFTAFGEGLAAQGLTEPFVFRFNGLEEGAVFTFGLPFYIFLGYATMLTGDAMLSLKLFEVLTLLLAFFAFYWLAVRQLKVSPPVAVLVSFLYLASALVYGQRWFGPQIYGFILLPFYVAAWVWYQERVCEPATTWRDYFAWTCLLVAVNCVNFFMIPYVFMIFMVFPLVAVIWQGGRTLRHGDIPWRRWWLLAGGFVLAFVIPVFLYQLYIPAAVDTGAYKLESVDYFRAQGVDLFSLIQPGKDLALYSWLGLARHWNPRAWFGDGSNVEFNFLGLTVIVAVVVCLVMVRQKARLLVVLSVAGLLTFLISLGPSLKIHDERAVDQARDTYTVDDYLMPPEAATLNLHTDFLYQSVPGINNMRAVHRWLLLTKFALLAMAAVAIQALWQRRRWLGILLAVLMLVELLPLQTFQVPDYPYLQWQKAKFQAELLEPLGRHLEAGDRVFFLSQDNDYLAPAMSVPFNIRTYNVSFDKTAALVYAKAPFVIQEMRRYHYVTDYTYRAMRAGLIHRLVIPFFSLRWESYSWPPPEDRCRKYREMNLGAVDVTDPRFKYVEEPYFGVLTLADPLPK
ncbi:MAG: hypothetical protein JXQ27_16475 [Acidobacteria bacterium]|nr:hypothetical protein [Acidobacteriota bacterium]